MTNMGGFVVSVLGQLPAHLTCTVLQTRINTHQSESVLALSCGFHSSYDLGNPLLMWTYRSTSDSCRGCICSATWDGKAAKVWLRGLESVHLDCIRLQRLRSVAEHQHRTMQWYNMPSSWSHCLLRHCLYLPMYYVFPFRRWLWWRALLQPTLPV